MNSAIEPGVVMRASAVCKSYQEGPRELRVLRGVDMEVMKGERIAVVGRSGSGKSTLLHLLGGLDRPDSGEVWINGREIFSLSERQRGELRNRTLGFVYQFHHLLPEFSALENVAMPLLIRRTAAASARGQAADMLARVGLAERIDHRPAELSGGERQRVAIARALVTGPACVLADEPTGNLDEETGDQINDLMIELSGVLQTSFIVVTHNSSLAAKMDRQVRLHNGVLVD